MRSVGTSLLTAWVFILATSGWCCHPASCCAPRAADAAARSPESRKCCCAHCGKRAPANRAALASEKSQPGQGLDNCYGVCTYLPASTSKFEVKLACQPFELAVVLLLTSADGQLSRGWLGSHHQVEFSPPARLHALYQVFLI